MKNIAFFLILFSLLILPFSTGKGHSMSLAVSAEASCKAHESFAEVNLDLLSDTTFSSRAKVKKEILTDTMSTPNHDFSVTSASVTPTSIQAGQQLTVNYNHCYSGDWSTTQLGSTPVYIYLSTNNSLGSGDVYIGDDQSTIGSNDNCEYQYSYVNIPGSTSPGTYYILIVADPNENLLETNESNNLGYAQVNVVFPAQSFLYSSTADVYVEQESGSSGTFTVSSNISWNINITNEAPWMNVSPTSGSGNATITLTATSENPHSYTRTAVLNISGSGVQDVTVYGTQIPVSELEVTTTSINLDKLSGATATFGINSNTWWNITDDADWLFISPTNGSYDATITVTTASANTTPSVRSATITITAMGYPNTYINVTQNANESLSVSPGALELAAAGGSNGIINVTSNTSWTVSDDATWLTVSPSSGSGNGTLTVTASSANTGPNTRSATVTISGNGVDQQYVTVSQLRQSQLSVSPATLQLASSTGASGNITVTSNVSWNVTDNADWLNVSPGSGSGNGMVSVTATSANSGTDPRMATVTISAAGVPAQMVTVTQAGISPQLSVSFTTLTLGQAAGSGASFGVVSNIPWSVSYSADWITVTPTSGSNVGTVTVTAASANMTSSPRSAALEISGSGVPPKTVTVYQEGLEGGPVLLYQSYSIDDGIDGHTGDGDGVIERNEFIDLMIMLNNTGSASATGVSATLNSAETGIQVISSTSPYENLPPGMGKTCLNAFRIYVTEFAPYKYYTMSLDITCNEGSYLSTFMLPLVVTGFEGQPPQEWISIYPNPTDGRLTLKLGKPVKKGTLMITDMTSRMIVVQDLDNQILEYNLDIGHLVSGPCVLQLVNDQYNVIRKIIVK